MNCKRIEKLILTDYIDGNLKGRDLEEVEAHLGSCPGCRSLAEELKSAGSLLRAAPRQEAPDRAWHKIRAEISAEPRGTRLIEGILDNVRYSLARLRPAVVAVSAALLVVFILTAIRLMPLKDYSQTGPAQDDILAASYMNGEEGEYDFGTAAERFFL